MSQFQPNYPPVGYSAPGMTPRDPRGPARRAGMTMIIASLIGLMCGGLFSLMGFFPRAQFEDAMRQAAQQNPQVATLPIDAVQSWAKKAGTAMVCICLAQIIVAIPVRYGGRGPVTVALGLSAISAFAMIIIALMHPNLIGNMMCVDFIFLVLTWAAVPFLIHAFLEAPHVKQFQATYQNQYAQFLQHQQAYQQPYGFTPPGMIPPPPGAGYAPAPTFHPTPYHMPPVDPQAKTTAQTGWQWPPPPPPGAAPAAQPPPSAGDASDDKGPTG